jgi:hypothetical protein
MPGMPVWTDIARNQSEKVKALQEWWESRRRVLPSGALDIPDRGDLDPTDLLSLLPNLLLADVEHDPFRIRYRLVGTRVAAVTAFEFTGRYLDDLLGPDPDIDWVDYYRMVYESRRPLMGTATVPTTSGATATYEFGIFPLTRGGERIEQFVAIEDYLDLEFTSMLLRPWRK